MKKGKKRKKNTTFVLRIWNDLCCPHTWFEFNSGSGKKEILVLFIYLCILLIGIILRHFYFFPDFYYFILLFSIIGIISLVSIRYFTKSLTTIEKEIFFQPFAQNASRIYNIYGKKNSLYVVIPLLVTIVFGCGGCKLYTQKIVSPIFVWVMVIFSLVVYISIVGYLQYILLFFYIKKLEKSPQMFKNIRHSFNEPVPAELGWLQQLTKLSHIYRSAFFTLGSLYVAAFTLFCFSPAIAANINSWIFYLLWLIIFVAIVLVFPFTAIAEYMSIKRIVLHIKKTYVKDLEEEINFSNKNKQGKYPIEYQKFILHFYAMKIMDSKEYPIKSSVNVLYNSLLGIFNFAAAIATIIQVSFTFSDVLHQMI